MARRQRVFLVLRMVASAVMLGILLSRIHISSVLPRKDATTLAWMITGVVIWFVSVVLASIRWQRVLDALDLHSELPPLVAYSLAGLFVGNFLPSTIGGDVLRVSRLSAANGQAPASFASVVVERLTGFVVLPLITLFALIADPHLLHLGTASKLSLLFSLGTLAVLVLILVLAAAPRIGGKLAGNESWLRFAGAVHLAVDRIRRHPARIASVLASAVVYQLTIVLAAWIAMQALGVHIGWLPVMAFIPVVAMAQVLPLSVNGLGLREGALVLLLKPLGVATTQAVAIGLLLYGMTLAVSLLGAPSFAVGSRAPARAAAA